METEESEEEEKPEHYKIYSGGQLYKSCFNAEEHFSKLAAMPRDARELGFIKEQAVQPTLLGGKCAGQKWVYLDGTSVPGAVISSSCVDGQLLCVQGQTVSACDGAKKIACQIPRLTPARQRFLLRAWELLVLEECRWQHPRACVRKKKHKSHGQCAVHHQAGLDWLLRLVLRRGESKGCSLAPVKRRR